MAILTKEMFTDKDGTKEEYVLYHRYNRVKVKENTNAKINEDDPNSDTISVPAGTEGYVVEFVDDEKVRVDLDIELGNGVVYGLRNKLALKSQIEVVEDWGFKKNMPDGYYGKKTD